MMKMHKRQLDNLIDLLGLWSPSSHFSEYEGHFINNARYFFTYTYILF
jgi:hypothetical protein